MPARWRIRLLGALSASDGDETIAAAFGAGPTAALLARLALHPGRRHAREELIDLLWPDASAATGRNRLRQTLFALRALLEPAAAVPRPVLTADRSSIGVVDGALACDAVDFERAVREGRHADAAALYLGELLPGHYDDWVGEERLRLAALHDRAVAALGRADAAPWPRQPAPTAAAGGPPATARRERSPLPAYLTRSFGRGADADRLRAAIAEHRLVSVVGPGGCGKTRLVAETCAGLVGSDGDGASGDPATAAASGLMLFVPLVGCADRAALLDAVVAALRLPAEAGDPLGRIVAALEAWPALVVLDNFEQLVDVAADVALALVGALPELRLVVTTRRALGADGERLLALSPLRLPGASASLADAAANPAVGLFVDRARATRADFRLGERNRAVLIELARALDGLPLALELAASRVRSVSPAEMLEHLRPAAGAPKGAGLALLARSSARPGHDPRHASMLRTVEWSWRLLAPPLQRLLAVVTVFEGGFTASAADAVLGAPAAAAAAHDADPTRPRPAEGRRRAQPGAGGATAAASATAAGGAGITVAEGGGGADARRGVDAGHDPSAIAVPTVVALDDLVAHSLLTAPPAGRLDRDDPVGAGPDSAPGDLDGISSGGSTRFALDASIRDFAAATLSPAEAAALRSRHRSWLGEWGRSFSPTPPLAALREELRNIGAALASSLADGVPREGVATMVALRRGLPDIAVPASTLDAFATALERADALATAGDADSAAGAAGSAGGDAVPGSGDAPPPGGDALLARGHGLLARLRLAAGAAEPSRRHAERGLAIARAVAAEARRSGARTSDGDELLARALQVAASVAWRTQRDAARCIALLDEAAPLAAASGDLGVHASAAALRAFVANVAERDLPRAEALHGEALRLWEAAGDAVSANNGRYNLAVCALRGRRFDEVLERLADVAAEAERQHDWRLLSQARNVEGEAQLGRRDWAAATSAYGQSLELAWSTLAQPSFAYALWNLPRALARRRDATRAARLAGAAERFWSTRMGDLDAADRRDLRRLERLLAAQLGEAAARRHWRDGAALPLPEVVALALGREPSPRP